MASASKERANNEAFSFEKQEKKVFSQNGEDGIIQAIFQCIGETDRIYVEIGCEDGQECNSRLLNERGWRGWLFDDKHQNEKLNLIQERFNIDNAVQILNDCSIPERFDFLSIDIDFNDFHVLNTILASRRPRVIVVEHNSSLGPAIDAVTPYLPNWSWDGTQWFGASLSAFCELAKIHDYTPVYVESNGVNLFLVQSSEWKSFPTTSRDDLYRSPSYGPAKQGHPKDSLDRPWLTSKHYLTSGIERAQTKYGVISYLKYDEFIGAIFSRGGYWEETEIVAVANKLMGVRGTCIDVGSHVGSHAIGLSKLCQDLFFVCFEPQEMLYLILERNVAENMLWSRFRTFQKAVIHSTGCTTRLASSFSDGTSFNYPIVYDGNTPANFGGVQLGTKGSETMSISLDELDLHDVVYLKIDVEGSEKLVFSGAKRMVALQKPLIFYEERTDRKLQDETLDYLKVPQLVRDFDIGSYLLGLGYKLAPLGQDFIAIPPLERHLELSHITPDASLPLSMSVTSSLIPPVLFQTWKSREDLPPYFAMCRDSFVDATPGFTRPLWSDDDNRDFINNYYAWFLPVYDSYPAEIYRADAIRYFFLYSYGGIYCDLDVVCLRSLDQLRKQSGVLLCRMGTDPAMPHSIPNAAMASQVRHPFWLLVIRIMMEVANKSGYNLRPEYMTGPVILKSAFDMWVHNNSLARQLVNPIKRLLSSELSPLECAKVRLLDSYHWFPLDWSDPIHSRFRSLLMDNGKSLTAEECKSLFPKSTLTTFWSHSWE